MSTEERPTTEYMFIKTRFKDVQGPIGCSPNSVPMGFNYSVLVGDSWG